jgi:hypothetical protein
MLPGFGICYSHKKKKKKEEEEMNIYIMIERGIYQTTQRSEKQQHLKNCIRVPTLHYLSLVPPEVHIDFLQMEKRRAGIQGHKKKENDIEKGYGCFKSNSQHMRDKYSTGAGEITVNKC